MPRRRTKSTERSMGHAGKSLSPKEQEANMAARNGPPTEAEEHEPSLALLWRKEKSGRESWTLVDLRRPSQQDTELRRKRKLNFKTLQNLIELTKQWRKPSYKNLRHVHVKDGVIIRYDLATHPTQANAISPIGYTREDLSHIQDRIVALGADSIYMIHHCPSTDSAPPSINRDVVALCSEMVPELRGHIIIYPASFCYVSVQGLNTYHVVPAIPKQTRLVLPNIHLSSLKESPKLAAWVKALTGEKRHFLTSVSEKITVDPFYKMDMREIDVLGTYVD